MRRVAGATPAVDANVPSRVAAVIEGLEAAAAVVAVVPSGRVVPTAVPSAVGLAAGTADVGQVSEVAQAIAVLKVAIGRPRVLAGRAPAMGHRGRPAGVVAALEAAAPVRGPRRRVRVAKAKAAVPPAPGPTGAARRPPGVLQRPVAVKAAEGADPGLAVPARVANALTTEATREPSELVLVHGGRRRAAAVPVHGRVVALDVAGLAAQVAHEDAIQAALRAATAAGLLRGAAGVPMAGVAPA